MIAAFNALRLRVTAMLDEKDRMLGAIGHDLRTPLASLRIRVESVEPAEERVLAGAEGEATQRLLGRQHGAKAGEPGIAGGTRQSAQGGAAEAVGVDREEPGREGRVGRPLGGRHAPNSSTSARSTRELALASSRGLRRRR